MKRVLIGAAMALGYVWSAPVTLAGLLVAFVGGAHLLAVRRGVLLFQADYHGACQGFFLRFGMGAFTWGAVTVIRWNPQGDELWPEELLEHERRHALQAFVLGPLMPLAYGLGSLWALATGGHPYRDNFLEVDARRAAGGEE